MEMRFYAAPEVELVEVAVEAGFAASLGDNTGHTPNTPGW